MKEQLKNNFDAIIATIVNESYGNVRNLGLVSDYIPKSLHTSDFELPNNNTLRVIEQKQSVYYTVFRAS